MPTSIIVVTNMKGGVGKTTATVNLAGVFAVGLGKRVLIIDLDYQYNATMALGVEDEAEHTGKRVGTAFREDWSIEQVRLTTNIPGVDVIAGDRNLQADLSRWSSHAKRFKLVSVLLDCEALEEYDVVLIDTHPSMDCYLQSALAAAHYYVVPVFPESHAFRGLGHFISLVEDIRRYENPSLIFLGTVVTKFDKASATHNTVLKAMRALAEKAKFRLFASMIPASTAVASAEARGAPMNLYKPTNPVALAYAALAGEILPELKGRRVARPPNRIQIPEIMDDFGESGSISLD